MDKEARLNIEDCVYSLPYIDLIRLIWVCGRYIETTVSGSRSELLERTAASFIDGGVTEIGCKCVLIRTPVNHGYGSILRIAVYLASEAKQENKNELYALALNTVLHCIRLESAQYLGSTSTKDYVIFLAEKVFEETFEKEVLGG